MLERLEHHPAAEADSAIVWMHGLGASSSDFLPVIPHLRLTTTRLVFPQAPSRPVTINNGHVMPAWYDIRSMAPGPDREGEDGIRDSATQIAALLDREISRGISPDRLLLAGFSQGGAMALHVAHRYPHTLAGVVVLSAYPLLTDRWQAEAHPANAATPHFLAHGRHDNVVPVQRGQQGRALIGARGEWHDYPMGHELCMEEIVDLREWLHARLG